jgi:hypothetical protein
MGEAQHAAREILAGVLGEMLAGAEWRRVRDTKGSPPTRRDLGLGLLDPRRVSGRDDPDD